MHLLANLLDNCLVSLPLSIAERGFGGVTGNRTRDTRIFSPLLYQLSYDTDLLCRCSNGIAKVGIFSDFANFHNTFFKKTVCSCSVFHYLVY